MGIGQFLPVVTALAAPWFMDRWGTGNTIIITGMSAALFMLSLAISGHWTWASASYIGVLLIIPIAAVARGLFSQEVVAPQWRTLMSAVFTIGLAFGWASAAGAGGFIIARSGYGALFLAGAMMSMVSCVLVWSYFRMSKPVSAEVSTAARLSAD
jgi:predicted MFS family arabinose efflux permease